MANSADPDQMASLQKPADLDLHCLQRQDISWFSRTRVKCPHVCGIAEIYEKGAKCKCCETEF